MILIFRAIIFRILGSCPLLTAKFNCEVLSKEKVAECFVADLQSTYNVLRDIIAYRKFYYVKF